MHLAGVLGIFSSDLAIDLGTANTLVYVRGRGIAVVEPSIVAVNTITNRVEAVGAQAKEMLGKTPSNIQAIRPMKDGVIADFEVTEKMIEHFIKKAHGRTLLVRPRIVISVPSEITQVEKRAVKDTALKAGASEVYLIEQAMAAAIGAGLPITEPSGQHDRRYRRRHHGRRRHLAGRHRLLRSVRVAGNEMDEAIIQYLKKKYNLLIGERTAEQIKIEIGSAYPLDEPLTMEIKGRDLIEGVPKTITITDEEIREALAETWPPSSTPCASRSSARRRSSRPTSWTRASSWPAAGRCSRTSTSACARRPACPSPTGRGPALAGGARHRHDAHQHRPAAQDRDSLSGHLPFRRGVRSGSTPVVRRAGKMGVRGEATPSARDRTWHA